MSDNINKFRVWNTKLEMYCDKEDYAIDPDGDLNIRRFSDLYDDFWLDVVEPANYVVERYTGLKSSNGVNIYEGDILSVEHVVGDFVWEELDEMEKKIQSEMNGKHYTGFVGRDSLEPCNMEIVCGNTYFPLFYAEGSELLGNINENPELLDSFPEDLGASAATTEKSAIES